MPKIIILNGPPASGKDCLAYHFLGNLPYTTYDNIWVEHGSFAKPLKQILQIQYNLSDAEIAEYDSNHLLKMTPEDRFGGKHWRQLCIDLSDELKAKFGKEYFGNHLADRIEKLGIPCNDGKVIPNVLITDGGFEEETLPLIRRFGVDNVIAIKLVREGHSYKGDSRKYLDYDKLQIKHYLVENKSSLEEYLQEGTTRLEQILTE
jgi:hypothetical protein